MTSQHRAELKAGRLNGVPSAPDDLDSLVPLSEIPTFDEMMGRLPPPDSWKLPPEIDYDGFFRAAVEASNLEKGLTLLAAPQPLAFDSSLTVRYVGEAASYDGCIFFGFLFTGSRFEVLVWVDDDACRVKLVWRGDQDDFLRSELMMRMFEGRTLEHLR